MIKIRFGIIGTGLMGREFASTAAALNRGGNNWISATSRLTRPSPARYSSSGFTDCFQQMLAAFLHELVHDKPPAPSAGCVRPDEVALSHHLFTAALELQKNHSTAEV